MKRMLAAQKQGACLDPLLSHCLDPRLCLHLKKNLNVIMFHYITAIHAETLIESSFISRRMFQPASMAFDQGSSWQRKLLLISFCVSLRGIGNLPLQNKKAVCSQKNQAMSHLIFMTDTAENFLFIFPIMLF